MNFKLTPEDLAIAVDRVGATQTLRYIRDNRHDFELMRDEHLSDHDHERRAFWGMDSSEQIEAREVQS